MPLKLRPTSINSVYKILNFVREIIWNFSKSIIILIYRLLLLLLLLFHYYAGSIHQYIVFDLQKEQNEKLHLIVHRTRNKLSRSPMWNVARLDVGALTFMTECEKGQILLMPGTADVVASATKKAYQPQRCNACLLYTSQSLNRPI